MFPPKINEAVHLMCDKIILGWHTTESRWAGKVSILLINMSGMHKVSAVILKQLLFDTIRIIIFLNKTYNRDSIVIVSEYQLFYVGVPTTMLLLLHTIMS